jgi:hypothetical protein
MAIVTTDDTHYKNIAETIRSWAGKTTSYRPEEMWSGIESVYWKGHADGQEAGGGGSYDEGYEQGKIDGDVSKYASVLRFKNAVFPDGYELTVHCDNATELPQFAGATGIKKVIIYCRTDKTYGSSQPFYPNDSIETVLFPNGVKLSSANYFATNCTQLVSVFGAMDITGITSDNLFTGCINLVDVEFVPLTITGNKNFAKSSKLSDASIQSIVDGYVDMTGQTSPTLTVHPTVGEKMTEEQKATLTAKNVTLAY